jgi:hypothetical protein
MDLLFIASWYGWPRGFSVEVRRGTSLGVIGLASGVRFTRCALLSWNQRRTHRPLGRQWWRRRSYGTS